MDRTSTPSMQLFALARAVRAIYAEFRQAVLGARAELGAGRRAELDGARELHVDSVLGPGQAVPAITMDTEAAGTGVGGGAGPPAGPEGSGSLGADGLVPIFIYAFCRAGLSRPIQTCGLLWALGHPDMLHGECGYYLTLLESSIAFVLEGPWGGDEQGEREHEGQEEWMEEWTDGAGVTVSPMQPRPPSGLPPAQRSAKAGGAPGPAATVLGRVFGSSAAAVTMRREF